MSRLVPWHSARIYATNLTSLQEAMGTGLTSHLNMPRTFAFA